MPTTSPQRLIELWPSLTEEQREALVEIAETAAMPDAPFPLTPEEANALERSKEDFKAGRTRSRAEAEAATDAFLQGLRATRA